MAPIRLYTSIPSSLVGLSLVESLNLRQSFVLSFSDEELDEDHAGDATRREEEECSGSTEVVIADKVQLGSEEVSDPP